MYIDIKVNERRFLEFFFIGTSGKKMKMPSSPNDSCSEPLESEDAKDVLQGQGIQTYRSREILLDAL